MAHQVGLLQLLEASFHQLKQGKIPSSALLVALASKALGYAIVVGSAIVKVPQILTVLRSKSADGLTFLSFELENTGLSVHAAYGLLMGLPFSAFGEAILLLLQNTVLLACMYYYNRAPLTRVLSMVGATAAGASVALSGRLTTETLQKVYDFNSVIFTAARVPQIVSNYRAQSTGKLSIFTYVMNLGGCLVRIFTSIQEGGGIAMVRGYVLGSVLNGILVGQILYYSSRRGKVKKSGNGPPAKKAQ